MLLSQPISYVLDIMLPPNQEGQNIAAMMFQATYWLHPFLQYLPNIQLTPIWWNPNSTNMYLVVSCHTTISIFLVFISLLWCQIVLSFFFFFFVFNNFAFYFLRKIWQMRSFFWFLSFLLLHFDLCWWLSRNFFRFFFFFFFSFFASFSLEWRCFKVSHKINTKIFFKFFICMLGAEVIES